MTVKERMMAIRLIEKIETQPDYANKIGLSYQLATTGANAAYNLSTQKLDSEKK